ncbi:hypothetical protein STEG23_008204 [Scotinomys teguina]
MGTSAATALLPLLLLLLLLHSVVFSNMALSSGCVEQAIALEYPEVESVMSCRVEHGGFLLVSSSFTCIKAPHIFDPIKNIPQELSAVLT